MAGQVLALYRANWPLLLATALIAFLALDIVAGALWLVVSNGPESALISVPVTIVASVYYCGMVATVVAARERGENRPSAVAMVMRVPAVRLLVADVLITVMICAGLALLVVPGLIALTLTVVAGPVIVLEGAGIVATFRRSCELVLPWFWPVLAIALAATAVTLAVTALVAVAVAALANGAVFGYLVGALLGNVITAPLLALTVGVLYFELRGAET